MKVIGIDQREMRLQVSEADNAILTELANACLSGEEVYVVTKEMIEKMTRESETDKCDKE